MPNNPISVPAGYAPAFAIGFAASSGGDLSIVEPGRPLPVTPVQAEASPPLTGSAQAHLTAGPFIPAAARPVFVTLAGTWQGSVAIARSTDDGATLQPLTLAGGPWATFTSNACEAVWEEYEAGAVLYLIADITSGTLQYRLSQ